MIFSAFDVKSAFDLGMRKRVWLISVLLLSILLTTSSCGNQNRGPYFLYGMQWGMSWQETQEMLKVKELKLVDKKWRVWKATAPFFIAGVPGQLDLTFKKPLIGKAGLKSFKYEASVNGADVRLEAYSVILADLETAFGAPDETAGEPEEFDPNEETGGDTDAEAYSATWRQPGGDIYLLIDPKKKKLTLEAEADTGYKGLGWLD